MKIAVKVAIAFAIPVFLIAFLGIASYNMQQGILKTNEYNELMYAPATRTLIQTIDDFTLLQDIIQYNPDAHTREEYNVTFERLMGYFDDYRAFVSARGSDGQYIVSEEMRTEFLGYADNMENYTIEFDRHAREILDIRENAQLNLEQKQQLVAEKMALADEPMWQFWYYLDIAKDTGEYNDLQQRQELSKVMITSNANMTVLLLAGAIITTAIAATTIHSITGRICVLRKSAELVGMQDYRMPVKVSGNDEMALLAQDFETMRKRVESYDGKLTETVKERTKELELAYADLKRLDVLKDEFINIAAHELRTPIQPILTYGELVEEGLVSQEEAWAVVTKQAKRLRNLANGILDVSKIDGGNLVLRKKELDINQLVKNVTNEKMIGLEKDVILQLKLADTKDIKLFADESRILQVLANLVDNAIKFTRKGTINVETQVIDNGSKMAVAVRDTGPGIPDEVSRKLFTKFATKDVSETSKNGTGLGLYICKGIIEAHGGTIAGNNAKEGGAIFRFVLPATMSAQTPELAAENKNTISAHHHLHK